MVDTSTELDAPVADWNRLALESPSPFTTHEWLSCWWSAFGQGDPAWLTLRRADGSLRGGAFLQRTARKALASTTNDHSGDWDVLASDDEARAELWTAVTQLGASRIRLQAMPDRAESTEPACAALKQAGYRTLRVVGPVSPWLALPSSWEQLTASVSSGLRSQVGRRRRALEREGSLVFRTVTGGPTLNDGLEGFLTLEGSGWKGRKGTSILSDARTERLYRGFADVAAARGWLRLHLLELDGRLIAADYGCAVADSGFLIKTCFDEAYDRFSPGLVLRAEVLQSSIEEGLKAYDFLGGPDAYKRRWTPELRPRLTIWAYRRRALPRYAYRAALRPALKAARDRARRIHSRRTSGPSRSAPGAG